jgi:hypothetical protein
LRRGQQRTQVRRTLNRRTPRAILNIIPVTLTLTHIQRDDTPDQTRTEDMHIFDIISSIFTVAFAPLLLALVVGIKLVSLIPLLVKWNTNESECGSRASERDELRSDEERGIHIETELVGDMLTESRTCPISRKRADTPAERWLNPVTQLVYESTVWINCIDDGCILGVSMCAEVIAKRFFDLFDLDNFHDLINGFAQRDEVEILLHSTLCVPILKPFALWLPHLSRYSSSGVFVFLFT